VTDLSVAPRYRETLAPQAAALKLDTILAGLDLLNATRAKLRTSNHGRVLLEMALVRLGRLEDLASLSQLAQWLAQPETSGSRAATANTESRPKAAPPEGLKKKIIERSETELPPTLRPLTPETLPQIWQDLCAQLGPMLGSRLQRAAFLAISGPNSLVIRFNAAYNSEREYCSDATRVARMEEALRKITGQACQFRVENAGGRALANSPETADEPEQSVSRYRRQRAEAASEPLLKRAIEALGAQIVQLDEGFGAAPAPVVEIERSETGEAEEV
jgi:DNA polymerase-3 subunit gamma/tau